MLLLAAELGALLLPLPGSCAPGPLRARLRRRVAGVSVANAKKTGLSVRSRRSVGERLAPPPARQLTIVAAQRAGPLAPSPARVGSALARASSQTIVSAGSESPVGEVHSLAAFLAFLGSSASSARNGSFIRYTKNK